MLSPPAQTLLPTPTVTVPAGTQVAILLSAGSLTFGLMPKSMTVTCDRVKGAQGVIRGVCVNLSASLHCPGKQLDYVRYVRLRLAFEAKNWDNRHPLGERVLSAVADGETLKLGEMKLVKQDIGEGWFEERMKEVLEVAVPYATFEKLARAEFVELSVGKTAFALREKNVAALRDLNNRVRLAGR